MIVLLIGGEVVLPSSAARNAHAAAATVNAASAVRKLIFENLCSRISVHQLSDAARIEAGSRFGEPERSVRRDPNPPQAEGR